MILPLSEQLDEQYERKVQRDKAEHDTVPDFDQYQKAMDEAKNNQKRLRETLTTEQVEKIERLKRRQEELVKYEKGESVDMRILKRKNKRSRFRPPPEEELDDEVDDHAQVSGGKKRKYRMW